MWGGYIEKHPEAESAEIDLQNLKTKVDAGADFITTQLFFDNAVYHHFVQRCRNAGIEIPVLPGLLPVLSIGQVRRFCAMCEVDCPLNWRIRSKTPQRKTNLPWVPIGPLVKLRIFWTKGTRLSPLCPE